ncbi:MAG: PASTA domain-containing protein [Clostridiales bacterium]|nr:PASTA domain-containing protein [Clostridiales bacterium]
MPRYGDWKEVRELGRGAYGIVYEIEKTTGQGRLSMTTRSALKVIRIPQSEDQIDEMRNQGEPDEAVKEYFEEMAAGVLGEVRAMNQLKGHSNIVSYMGHEVRLCEDGISQELLIQMELLTPLNKYVKEHKITRKTVIQLGIDICSALERCQKFDIIHRDIKPSNILVNESGDFKLSDFGIARRVAEDATMAALSQKGTPTYMAPEIYWGQAYGFSVDLYSLGIVMYRLLNHNRDPFLPPYPEHIQPGDGTRAQTCRLKGDQIPPPDQDSGQLAEIVLKACSYDPADRYSSPRQMREDLEKIQYADADWEQVVGTDPDTLTIEPSGIAQSGSDASGSVSVEQEDKNQGGEQNGDEGADDSASGKNPTIDLKAIGNASGNLTVKLNDDNAQKTTSEEENADGDEADGADSATTEPEATSKENGTEDTSDGGSSSTEEAPPPTDPEPGEDSGTSATGESDGADGAPANRPKLIKIAAILLVVLLGVVGGCVRYYMSTTSEVPDVSQMTEQEAVEALEDVSLTVGEEKWVNSDEVDKGCVISVSNAEEQVSAGKRVAKNTSLTLTLSLGSIVTVPNELGSEGEEAVAVLEKLGLTVSTDSDYSDDYAEGRVIAQSLEAESDVNEGTEIVLTLSLGPKPFELESYTGQTLEDAQTALETLGLTVEVKKSYSTEVEKGYVIKQSPEAGEQVRKGDTVTITVSKGPEQVEVPNVTGMTVNEAKAALEAVGLTLGERKEVYSDYTDSGYITEQGTAAGTEVQGFLCFRQGQQGGAAQNKFQRRKQ